MKLSTAFISAALLFAACGSDSDDDVADASTEFDAEYEYDDEFGDEYDDEYGDEYEGDAAGAAGTVDMSLTRDDVDCSAEGLGEDETSTFTTAHYVVGGALGAACFGVDDPTLTQAWEALSAITPSLQLADLGVFGSFESTEGGDEVTLAF
ncbi:MAG: hypothetical protein P8H61_09325, partial [Ilumatobacter sp.]|nr:hypothetical protein [Ilumatobacter sp.]